MVLFCSVLMDFLIFALLITLPLMLIQCRKKKRKFIGAKQPAKPLVAGGFKQKLQKPTEGALTGDKVTKSADVKANVALNDEKLDKEGKIKTPPPLPPVETFTSTARRRKREQSVKLKVNSGFYLPESAQDDTLEKLRSLEEEKSDEDKSISKKKKKIADDYAGK